MTQEPLVYIRGELVSASQAYVNIYDFGIVLGATVTDMVRTARQQPYRLEEHTARFYESCKYARIPPPVSAEQTNAVIRKMVAHNAALLPPSTELCIAYFITPGEQLLYAGSAINTGVPRVPTYCLHTFPLRTEFFRHLFADGAHVVIPQTRHVPPQCIDPKIKNRSRLHWWLAEQEAQLVDPKAVTLLLDLDGNLTECSGSNILLIKNGTVFSPDSRNILRGITRKLVAECCQRLGIPFVERNLQLHDLINADEAFLASTPYFLAPVKKVNGIRIGGDEIIGPILRRLLVACSEDAGVDILKEFV